MSQPIRKSKDHISVSVLDPSISGEKLQHKNAPQKPQRLHRTRLAITMEPHRETTDPMVMSRGTATRNCGTRTNLGMREIPMRRSRTRQFRHRVTRRSRLEKP